MIKPTVGRVVLFQPHKPIELPLRDQPFAATISYVWGDRMVNLSYVDQNGTAGNATSVALLQDDDVPSDRGYFAYWMPHQKVQAAKADGIPRRESRELAVERLRGSGHTNVHDFLRDVDLLARYIESGSVPAQNGEDSKNV
jgi:hypothetical protein